jgi:hypothetical protein
MGLLRGREVPARRLRRMIATPPRRRAAEAQTYVDARAARVERRRQAMAHMSVEELVSAIGELRRQASDMAEQIQLVMERLRALHA